jgi:hypothetical protein
MGSGRWFVEVNKALDIDLEHSPDTSCSKHHPPGQPGVSQIKERFN